MASRENRKEDLAALHGPFFRDTQPASDVLRRRIRELREAKFPSQEALAIAMTKVGVPLTGDKISKIETGVRRVHYDELLALAYVFKVPLAQMMRPHDDERPIRAGGIGLGHDEVANWIIWGAPYSQEALSAQEFMRLTLQIQTMYQVRDDERDPVKRKEANLTVARLVKELWQASGIRPGVMERKALREAMRAGRPATVARALPGS